MTDEAIPRATVNPDGSVDIDGDAVSAARSNLENALKSVDNLTQLLTMLCEEKKKKAAAVEVVFLKSEIGSGVRVYITASDNLDEVALGKKLLAGLSSALQSIAPSVQP